MFAPHNSNQSPLAHKRVHYNAIRNVLRVLGIPYEDVDMDVNLS